MSNRDTVTAWFGRRLACGPIARDTPAYNQAFEALDDLIARLDGANGGRAAPVAEAPAPETPEAVASAET